MKYTTIIIALLLVACNKSGFLNTKPNASLVVIPTSLTDAQALLDNDGIMNNHISPAIGEAGSTDYFLMNSDFTSLDPIYQNEYTWLSDPYPGTYLDDWDLPYRAIFYANSALYGLTQLSVSSGQQGEYNNIKGSALFYRANMFYQLAQVFAAPYDSATANTDLGIALLFSSDINQKVTRSTVQQTYQQIIADATQAIPLLPITPLYGSRPGRPAAYALLARTYLTMRDYGNAGLYADSCLQLYNVLTDYNTLNLSAGYPIARFNNENLFNGTLLYNEAVEYGYVDSALIQSYQPNDLRPMAWFGLYDGYYYYKCSYDGSYYPYSGIATDEVYLIRAESSARLGYVDSAMNDLNRLLVNRFVTGSFVPYTASNATDALTTILTERRKELIFRGLRWMDLRRLNIEPTFSTALTRVENGITYKLPSNDLRYTWLIPDPVISSNSGMQQNPR